MGCAKVGGPSRLVTCYSLLQDLQSVSFLDISLPMWVAGLVLHSKHHLWMMPNQNPSGIIGENSLEDPD